MEIGTYDLKRPLPGNVTAVNMYGKNLIDKGLLELTLYEDDYARALLLEGIDEEKDPRRRWIDGQDKKFVVWGPVEIVES